MTKIGDIGFSRKNCTVFHSKEGHDNNIFMKNSIALKEKKHQLNALPFPYMFRIALSHLPSIKHLWICFHVPIEEAKVYHL
jgi:hypothetical protein